MDRLTSLSVFAGVAECGGFSAAARRLNMSVTMVSNHVQALEDRLGVRLLNRTTRKVSLTEIGRSYYERSSRILAELDEADRVAGAMHATPTGTLRMHASVTLTRFLAPVMVAYLRSYPGVSIELDGGDEMVDVIAEGYDLVIRSRVPNDSGLIVRKLTPWRQILCCSPIYLETHPRPERLSDLTNHNCLQFSFAPFGNELRFEGPDGKPASVHVSGNMMTSSAEALSLLTAAGIGIIFAPAFLVMEGLARGTLVPLLPDYRGIEFEINAVYPSRHHVSAKVRTFIDLLAAKFETHEDWADLRR